MFVPVCRRPWPPRGLTLLEVLVVLVILGMIAGIVTKVVTDRVERARVDTARIQMTEVMDALDLFYLDNSFHPSLEQGLAALVQKPTGGRAPEKYPEGGYLRAVPLDPWGRAYVYVCPGAHGKYDLICLGRDGVEGGDGYDADLGSWEIVGQKTGTP
jgi:general secretion pathway protein G